MIIWTVSDVIAVALAIIVIFVLMTCGMFYLIGQVIEKMSKWREKRWERKYDQK